MSLLSMSTYGQVQPILITQKSGATYIYQSSDLKGNVSYDIFRKQEGSDFVKLTDQPVKSVQEGFAFRDAIGREVYNQLAQNIGTESPMATYLTIKNDSDLRAILSFTNVNAAEALGYLFIDETAAVNSNYTYKIVYRRGARDTAYDSILVQHKSVAFVPIVPEEIGLAVSGENKIALSWQFSQSEENEYINGFNIYAEDEEGRTIKINENLILKTNQSDFTYDFEIIFDNRTYSFFIKSQDMTRQESSASTAVKMKLIDQMAPESIKGLVANSYKGSPPTITWRVNLANDLRGYNIYRAPRTIDEFEKINSELLSPYENYFVDETVTPGRKYAYAVTAVDSAGNESKKTSKTSVFIEDYVATDAPKNLKANYNESTEAVDLEWDFAYEAEDFRTFMITRQVDAGVRQGSPETVNLKALRETRFSDNGPTGEGFISGYIYHYKVVAIDDFENRSDTAILTFQIPDLNPPQPPEVKVDNDNGHRINLTWSASPDYDVIRYRVYRKTNDKDTLLAESHYSERLYRDESVQIGTQYIYTISAVDSLGNEGPRSAADSILMKDFSPPLAVRNITANAAADGVSLNWEPVPDTDLFGYVIFKSDIATGVYKAVTPEPVQSLNYTDISGKAGEWYKIKAVDTSGNTSLFEKGTQAIKREIE